MVFVRKVVFFIKYRISGRSQQADLSLLMNSDEIRDVQLASFNRLIQYLWNHSPFYKEKWIAAGIVSPLISSLSEVTKFPIVTKDELRDAISKKNLNVEHFKKSTLQKTTGSTGHPLSFRQERELFDLKRTISLRALLSIGFIPGEKIVKLWRASFKKSLLTRLRESIEGVYTLSIYDPENSQKTKINQQRADDLWRYITSVQPEYIDGFVSAFTALIPHWEHAGKVVNWRLKGVITGAERLVDDDRQLIQRFFKVPVYNRYGGTETSLIAHECQVQAVSEHRLHIQEDRHFVEVVDESNNVLSNGKGKIVVTDLDSKMFPLVRYVNGDEAEVSDSSKCNCGSSFRLIDRVIGRTNENFLLKDGSQISSHLWQNIFKKISQVKSYRLIQQNDYSVDFYLIPNVNLDEIQLENMRDKISQVMIDCEVRCHLVEEIPLSVGGKFSQHICMVKRSE